MSEDKRLAIVTGGSSGIGYEFSRILAGKGWDILIVSNNRDQLKEAAEKITDESKTTPYGLYLDLSDPEATHVISAWLRDKGKVPHLLVNNAGIFDFTTIEDLSEERIRTYINLHILTTTLLSRQISCMMAEKGVKGYILNMSSMSCWMPMPGIALYSASKAYIRVMSRALGTELADKGISVTVACPGGIATGLFGLSPKLLRLGVKLGVLAAPDKFAEKALKKTFRRRRQYINGLINRIAILAVGITPFRIRRMIKHKLLDNK